MQKLENANYDSAAAFLKAANDECLREDNRETRDGYIKHDNRNDWYGAGCKTGADVQRLLRDGWNEGREKAVKSLSQIDTSSLVPLSRKRRLHRGDMGDDLLMDRVWSGDLETAWTYAKRRRLYGPQQISILANMICHGGENADVLFWRGAAAIAVADKLEEAGYIVRLLVGFGGVQGGNHKVSCRVIIKDYGAPLDIATASSVILPGFFRAIGHGWIAGHTKGRDNGDGISVEKCIVEKDEIFLSHEVRDEKTALKWSQDLIAKINREAQGEAA